MTGGEWVDFENPGLQIDYNKRFEESIPGARDSLGVPIEPDEDVYSYSVKGIRVLDVSVDLSKLDVSGVYATLDDLIEDVDSHILAWLMENLG